MHLKIANL